MSKLKICFFLGALVTAAWAQSKPSTPPLPATPAKAAPTQAKPQEAEKSYKPDQDDLLADTQQSIRGENHVGMVWWIPFEFWEASDESGKTEEALGPLREYTVVAVVTGKVGPFGVIDFQPPQKVQASTFLRDSQGREYAPMAEVSDQAKMLTQLVKPIFTNALGKMGESIQLVFFPAKDKDGKRMDDPRSKGKMTVVLKDGIAGEGIRTFDFQLPLNSMVPPRYCPQGKERVQANWNYCPWHGVPLAEEAKK